MNGTPSRDNPEPGKDKAKGARQQKQSRRTLIAVVAVMVALLAFTAVSRGTPEEPVSLQTVYETIDSGKVTKAEFDPTGRQLTLTLEDATVVRAGYLPDNSEPITAALDKADVPYSVTTPRAQNFLVTMVFSLLPMFIIIGLLVWAVRKMSPGSISGKLMRTDNKQASIPATRFADVAGVDEAIEDLHEIVEFLQDPRRYEHLGARVPRGALLVGPPGTGKTLLARAAAGEAGVPFWALSGSDFMELFVGVGPGRVRETFKQARAAGRAIIFIDEIDAIGKRRGNGVTGMNDERENTLNALLVEMDGFTESGVIVLAATNRPDVLDPALLRSGRFDRRVVVGLPDREGRRKLFRMYLQRTALATGVNAEDLADQLARRSTGMAGADVAAVANEAALGAARDGASGVDATHCLAALERVALGRERRSVAMSERAKRITAWHEAGHAVCGLMVEGAGEPERVSIIPRGGAGGVTWFAGDDDEHFVTRTQAAAQLVVAMGGRAAEEVLLDGDFTQGAQSDIAQATMRAEKMVYEWGMGPSLVRTDLDRIIAADDPSRLAVTALVDDAMDKARATVGEHRVLVEMIADLLLEQETVEGVELRVLQGRYLTAGNGNADEAVRQDASDEDGQPATTAS